MIQDLDATLKALLEDELAVRNESIAVKFDQPTREWGTRMGDKHTLNLFLYDVRENNTLRQHGWQLTEKANGNGRSKRRRAPFRIDCHYVLTAWAKEAEDQHTLLSRAMAALLRHPLLPEQYQVGSMQDQPFPIQAQLAAHDQLTNPAELWSALDNEIRPGVSYLVTIAINPWDEEKMEEPVRTRRTVYRQRDRAGTTRESVKIGGLLSANGQLPDGVEVTLANDQWQFRSEVDVDGRYTINHVAPATYTLTAWLPSGAQSQRKLGERQVTVPPPVQVLALADTFHLQIGEEVALEGLHLSPRRDGYIGEANLGNYRVQEIGIHLPRSGTYQFGRLVSKKGKPARKKEESDGEESEPAVVTADVPSTVSDQPSFQLVYKQEDKSVGDYNLEVAL